MYMTVRKYRLQRSEPEVREAVTAGVVPVLKTSPGFAGCWAMTCTDGDLAMVSLFDTEANAHAATDKTIEWVQAYGMHLVVMPAEAMFGGIVQKMG